MNKTQLAVVDFGEALIKTGDLDPIYLMLNDADTQRVINLQALMRWCLAYWLFYHAGVACRITEKGSKRFWGQVWEAQNLKWPRGTERRHFKGAQSAQALTELSAAYPYAEDAVAWVATGSTDGDLADQNPRQLFADVAARAKSWRGFGPWISFKVADMVDAVLGVEVDFSQAIPDFFDDPVVGAFIVEQQRRGTFGTVLGAKEDMRESPPDVRVLVVNNVVDHLQAELGKRGLYPRIQEVETILCKYKSHLNGHYPVGKDTREIYHGLKGQGELAEEFREVLYPRLEQVNAYLDHP